MKEHEYIMNYINEYEELLHNKKIDAEKKYGKNSFEYVNASSSWQAVSLLMGKLAHDGIARARTALYEADKGKENHDVKK